MAKTTRERYTLEFKQEAVRLVEGGQSIAAAARTLGVVDRTLSSWVKAKREGKLTSSPSSSPEQVGASRARQSKSVPDLAVDFGSTSKVTAATSPYRAAIERMEEHEIIHRLTTGQFSDEAKPVAEATLRQRGIDPSNPVVPEDQRLPQPTPRYYLAGVFSVIAAVMAGRQIGAAIDGAIGAAIVAGLLGVPGWWVGKRLSKYVRHIQSGAKRVPVTVAATVLWLLLCGAIGILVTAGSGRFNP
jgi:transposase